MLHLLINLRSIMILTILSLSIHKHRISFHFFILFKFYQQYFVVSVYKCFTYFVTFIAKYFIICNAVTLIFNLFFVYYLLILHLTASLDTFVSANSLLMDSVNCSICKGLQYMLVKLFSSFFPIWIPLIMFFLIAQQEPTRL